MAELETIKDQKVKVKQWIEGAKEQIALALPKHITPDRMLRVCLTSILNNPALLECTRESMLGSIMEFAQLGIEPGGVLGQGYIIPYRNKKNNTVEAQFQLGYKGMLMLARRSGEVSNTQAQVVFENDTFRYQYGLNPVLDHIPARTDRGNAIYVYAIVKMKDGSSQFEVMSVEEINKVRDKHSKAQRSDSPWNAHWDAMAQKTVFKRLFKWLPVSIEIQRAIELDEYNQAGIITGDREAQNFTLPEPQTKSIDSLTESLEQPPEPELTDEQIEGNRNIVKAFDKYKVTESMILSHFNVMGIDQLDESMRDELARMFESMEKSESAPEEFFPELRETVA